MKPGHPYLTRELDEQRARQRQILRSIPDQVMERIRTTSSAGPLDTSDNAFIEGQLRDEADEEIKALVAELKARGGYERPSTTVAWLRQCDPGQRPSGMGAVVHRLELVAQEAYVNTWEPDRYYDSYARLYALLKWADQLAGDYTDPRQREDEPDTG